MASWRPRCRFPHQDRLFWCLSIALDLFLPRGTSIFAAWLHNSPNSTWSSNSAQPYCNKYNISDSTCPYQRPYSHRCGLRVFINMFDSQCLTLPFRQAIKSFSQVLLCLICRLSFSRNFIYFYHQRTWPRCQFLRPSFWVGLNWTGFWADPQLLIVSCCGTWVKWKYYDLLLMLRSSCSPSLNFVKEEFLEWKGSSSILLPIQHFLMSIYSSMEWCMIRKITQNLTIKYIV